MVCFCLVFFKVLILNKFNLQPRKAHKNGSSSSSRLYNPTSKGGTWWGCGRVRDGCGVNTEGQYGLKFLHIFLHVIWLLHPQGAKLHLSPFGWFQYFQLCLAAAWKKTMSSHTMSDMIWILKTYMKPNWTMKTYIVSGKQKLGEENTWYLIVGEKLRRRLK